MIQVSDADRRRQVQPRIFARPRRREEHQREPKASLEGHHRSLGNACFRHLEPESMRTGYRSISDNLAISQQIAVPPMISNLPISTSFQRKRWTMTLESSLPDALQGRKLREKSYHLAQAVPSIKRRRPVRPDDPAPARAIKDQPLITFGTADDPAPPTAVQIVTLHKTMSDVIRRRPSVRRARRGTRTFEA